MCVSNDRKSRADGGAVENRAVMMLMMMAQRMNGDGCEVE